MGSCKRWLLHEAINESSNTVRNQSRGYKINAFRVHQTLQHDLPSASWNSCVCPAVPQTFGVALIILPAPQPLILSWHTRALFTCVYVQPLPSAMSMRQHGESTPVPSTVQRRLATPSLHECSSSSTESVLLDKSVTRTKHVADCVRL